MSVRPVKFNTDGSIDVVFDEMGHSGTVLAADVVWTKNMDGTDNHQFINLPCPDGCGATSTWPVGGGADAIMGQQMFVKKVEREGCPCGSVEVGRTDAVAESHVRLQVNRMDGLGRWQQDDAETRLVAATMEDTTPTFEVVYQPTSGLIVGMLPQGGVGEDVDIVVLDMVEYDNLMRYVPAYLSADNEHIVSTPRA